MFEPFGQIDVIASCLKGKHKSAQGNALGFDCPRNSRRPERAKLHRTFLIFISAGAAV